MAVLQAAVAAPMLLIRIDAQRPQLLGEPVGAAALAFVVLDEVPRMTTLIGCTITLTAVALALRASRR